MYIYRFPSYSSIARDGLVIIVYCLPPKAFEKEDCDQLTALNFKEYFILSKALGFFVFIYSLFLYFLGSVTSVISVILISVYYCC